MIGYFKINSFIDETDKAGYSIKVNASSVMDDDIKVVMYLPPYLRKAQSNITNNSVVFGVVDDVSGLGAALCGLDGADFQYFYDADIDIKKSLSVKDDITTTNGDVIAKTTLNDVTLKDHIHKVTMIQSADCEQIVGSAESGSPAFTNIETNAPNILP